MFQPYEYTSFPTGVRRNRQQKPYFVLHSGPDILAKDIRGMAFRHVPDIG